MYSLANIILLFTLNGGLIGWSTFESVTFQWKYNEDLGAQIQMPHFGREILELEGTEIELSGYYLPLEINRYHIIISKQPFASCFFCGGDNGPESVAEIHFSEKPPRMQADEIVHVRGKLKLNPDDFDHMVFILEEARIVE